jgi:hypothetical protein
MIHESEVLNLLGEEIPEINPELERLPNAGSVYKSMQCFADFTREHIVNGNLKAAKQCMSVAEKMLAEGSITVKNAIENVFLFSISAAIDFTSPVSDAVKKMMKGSLRKEYHRQTTHSGI